MVYLVQLRTQSHPNLSLSEFNQLLVYYLKIDLQDEFCREINKKGSS